MASTFTEHGFGLRSETGSEFLVNFRLLEQLRFLRCNGSRALLGDSGR